VRAPKCVTSLRPMPSCLNSSYGSCSWFLETMCRSISHRRLKFNVSRYVNIKIIYLYWSNFDIQLYNIIASSAALTCKEMRFWHDRWRTDYDSNLFVPTIVYICVYLVFIYILYSIDECLYYNWNRTFIHLLGTYWFLISSQIIITVRPGPARITRC